MTFWPMAWQAMQFFFCARSGLAHAGAESMQAVTIVARRTVFMRGPGCRDEASLGYHQDNGTGSRRLTRKATRQRPHAGRNRMLFVVIGVILIALNLADIGTVGAWNWQLFGDLWKFALPFGCAAVWWVWSDWSGLNKRREMARMDKKKDDRRKENLAALGMDTRARRKAQKQQR